MLLQQTNKEISNENHQPCSATIFIIMVKESLSEGCDMSSRQKSVVGSRFSFGETGQPVVNSRYKVKQNSYKSINQINCALQHVNKQTSMLKEVFKMSHVDPVTDEHR